MHLNKDGLASLALRLGLAYVFIFAAGVAVIKPETDYKYIPSLVTTFISPNLFLMLFGGFEILLALWLIIGKKTFYSGLLAALVLFGLTILNLSELINLFRNAAIICAALALAILGTDSNS